LESFKADSLSEEIKDLKVRLDSLQRVEMKVNKNRANRYVLSRDSVQAGDGLFQVMARMGIRSLTAVKLCLEFKIV
jgi:hypothetical protein